MLPRHEIKRMALDDLHPAERNPRVIGDDEAALLREGLAEFGQVETVCWNKRTGRLIGGHQRVQLLRLLGATEADVTVVDLDAKRAEILSIHLNNRRAQGVFDDDALNIMLDDHEGDPLFSALGLDEIILADDQEDDDDADEHPSEDEVAEKERRKKQTETQYPETTPKTSASTDASAYRYQIVVDCTDEQQQGELLGRFAGEGLTCRALIL